MHEGFVNFNAGTLGRSMVEGRVTPGVTVGTDSDVGAGDRSWAPFPVVAIQELHRRTEPARSKCGNWDFTRR
jgi:hypothetical protein